jgi:hypothetical protein
MSSFYLWEKLHLAERHMATSAASIQIRLTGAKSALHDVDGYIKQDSHLVDYRDLMRRLADPAALSDNDAEAVATALNDFEGRVSRFIAENPTAP